MYVKAFKLCEPPKSPCEFDKRKKKLFFLSNLNKDYLFLDYIIPNFEKLI